MDTLHPIYINAQQVEKVLTWPLINAAVEEALKAVDLTKANESNHSPKKHAYKHQPSRSMLRCENSSKVLLTMPSFVANYSLPDDSGQLTTAGTKTLACKLVTSFTDNSTQQPPLPNILANILLFNNETGRLQCIMDGTQITAWRTAAASIVATKYLYFQRRAIDFAKSFNLAIVGCGVQGQSHALGMCSTFHVKEIYLWNRTKSKAIALADKLKRHFFPKTTVHVKDNTRDATQNADVICVATYSSHALFDYSMLKSDEVHINAVGAGQVHYGEVAQDIYDRAVVYVDSAASAEIELRGLKAHIVGEVGALIRFGGISDVKSITIFQSMGIAAEDATVAQAVYNILECGSI